MIHDVDEEYSHIRLKKWKKSAEPKLTYRSEKKIKKKESFKEWIDRSRFKRLVLGCTDKIEIIEEC